MNKFLCSFILLVMLTGVAGKGCEMPEITPEERERIEREWRREQERERIRERTDPKDDWRRYTK